MIEIPMPKHSCEKLSFRLERFAERFRKTVDAGFCACLTDNAMGSLTFQGHEVMKELSLSAPGGQVMIHLNTFHSRSEFMEILDTCAEMNVRTLLVISGDGSSRLPKLSPSDIGMNNCETVTSVELLRFIRHAYGDTFQLGAAFNQYEPPEHERGKLARKLDAGIDFVITQPVIGSHPEVDRLRDTLKIPLYVEAWMSQKIQLLSDCIGYQVADCDDFDPMKTLDCLHENYPDSPKYLALVNFSTQFDVLKER